MVLTKIDNLKEGDILAEDVLTTDYKVLLARKTSLTNEKILLLKKNGINAVNVENTDKIEEVTILKKDVQIEVHGILQKILERHTYSNTAELSELVGLADTIISQILEEQDITEKLYDIKQRNCDVYEHSIQVCSVSTLIALKNKMSINMVHDISVACLLHELGLQYLNLNFENIEINDMNEMDAEEYKKHPIYGYSTLQNEEWLSDDTKQMILYHHERIDGSGYPMKTTELSRQCRIIQVCDAFDELICGIGCERVKVYEALEYLKIYKGSKFDKDIVDDFLALIAVYPVGSYVRTNEGEVAVVLRQNREFPDRPVIRIIKNKDGNPVKNIIIKDLIRITTLFIEDAE